jgi:hypothetical protein
MYNYIVLTSLDKIDLIDEKIKNYESLIYYIELRIVEGNIDESSIDDMQMSIAEYESYILALNAEKDLLSINL